VGLCRLQELKLAGLSRRGPGFDPRPVNFGFMADKVALRQVFLRVILFFPRHCPSAGAPNTFIHLPPTLATDSISTKKLSPRLLSNSGRNVHLATRYLVFRVVLCLGQKICTTASEERVILFFEA